uniref:Uncharacterized protein n=1 Tax=Solanum tuberosum TaxID=4113 RepID=M1C489_SOLTU
MFNKDMVSNPKSQSSAFIGHYFPTHQNTRLYCLMVLLEWEDDDPLGFCFVPASQVWLRSCGMASFYISFDVNISRDLHRACSRKHTNNRSQGRPSKKKREAIKRKQQQEAERNDKTDQGKRVRGNQNQQLHTCMANQKSDYDVLNSEDEFDEDTHSLNEEEEDVDVDVDGDETSAHLIKAFGSTFQSESQAEIQTVADQQCLSPRGRKQVRQQTRQASMSTSANSSRPNTRSKSKGF